MRFSIGVLFVVLSFTALGSTAAADPKPGDSKSPSGEELFKRNWTPNVTLQQKSGKTDPNSASRRVRNRFDPAASGDGLGPLHNATSCADCHPRGGAAGVEHNVTLISIDPRSEVLEPPATTTGGRQIFDVFPGLLSERGALAIETVVHDKSTRPGYDEIRNRLASFVEGGINDAWFVPAQRTTEAIAAQPTIAGRHENVRFYLTQRNPPPLFGLGLIERIAPSRLERLAQDQAKKTNGRITGRAVSKFGWRGQVATLPGFVSLACAGELGLSQPTLVQPGDPADLGYRTRGPDMATDDVTSLVTFINELPQPTESLGPEQSYREIHSGEDIFNSIGCVHCHVPDVLPAMNIFSDLLLHDMGEKLRAASPAPLGSAKAANPRSVPNYVVKGPFRGGAPEYYSSMTTNSIPTFETEPQATLVESPNPRVRSTIDNFANRAEKDASAGMTWNELQREWRTPPLWGVADTAPYLHDGRAKTLEKAILWHGGEAQASRDGFVELNPAQKRQVLAFLSSLQAPAASP